MLSPDALEMLAHDRLSDAQALRRAGRLDGALYMAGYVIEFALKRRICLTLGWDGYPQTRAEFQPLISFRTHDLEVLLRLSGQEKTVRALYRAEWSILAAWTPESRYDAGGRATSATVDDFINTASLLLPHL